ncbi:hypothetical protein ACFVFQ_07320 [Streptomyces sp. NPDC057743]
MTQKTSRAPDWGAAPRSYEASSAPRGQIAMATSTAAARPVD